MSAQNDARRKWFGGKWITPVRRLALYLRDSMACVWCLAAVEDDGVRLSLDHVKANVSGGGNESTNLVTCCTRCNSARGKRSVATFARAVAEYLDNGTTAGQIVRRVRGAQKRSMVEPLAEAKRMIAERTISELTERV